MPQEGCCDTVDDGDDYPPSTTSKGRSLSQRAPNLEAEIKGMTKKREENGVWIHRRIIGIYLLIYLNLLNK